MQTKTSAVLSDSRCLLYFPQPQQLPQLPEQWLEQVPLSGQPMHFLPCFLAFHTSPAARPTTVPIIAIRMRFSIGLSPDRLFLIRFCAEPADDAAENRDGSQAGQETCTQSSLSDQSSQLVRQEGYRKACGQLEATPPQNHFRSPISEFMAPKAAKQGGVNRLNIR